jgi:serine/threonine-protein kinase
VEEMAALAEAYGPEHIEAALRGVSPCVKAVLHRALRREPQERYASAEEMRVALQACVRTIQREPYGVQEAARELLVAKTEAEQSPLREKGALLEWGLFADEAPRYS